MFYMLNDITTRGLIKIRHLLLRKPHGLIRELDLNVRLSIFTLIYDYLVGFCHLNDLFNNVDVVGF